jgi:hypothetical protein
VNLTVTWRFLIGACELIQILYEKKTAVVVLKMLGANVHNLFAPKPQLTTRKINDKPTVFLIDCFEIEQRCQQAK